MICKYWEWTDDQIAENGRIWVEEVPIAPLPTSRLWKLEIKEYAGYDTFDAFLVRANSESAARQLIKDAGPRGEEGIDTWTNPELSTCTEVMPSGEAEIIISSFNAG